MSRENEINVALQANRDAQDALRRAESALVSERATLVSDVDRAEMKRRGHVTHTWRVTEVWASANKCPFCLTACASSRHGLPNEQNSEYRCGNVGAIK